ncbi:BamA/TamA family outer membrane protein [uncultured Microscilla sp.]|uniref:translocation and assembly module lipoprotein TamL n=1 Tax=uncultured Microscilla sp. TaxID=432653 RepID=UPI0026019D15|nr:BamA/TamA family outer membrane protein [uncultured Microscilla sp.]
MLKTVHYLGGWLLVLGVLSGCMSTKNWKKGQYFLRSQEIKGNKKLSSGDLEALFRQKTNSRFLFGYPSVAAYNYGLKRFDREKVRAKIEKTKAKYDTLIEQQEARIGKAPEGAKREKIREKVYDKVHKLKEKKEEKVKDLQKKMREGNWWMRSVGEKPVFYDSLKAKESAKEMEAYYRSKGFFQATVDVETKRNKKRKKVKVYYKVEEGKPLILGKIEYVTENKVIDSLLTTPELRRKSPLKQGKRYDEEDFNTERTRIVNLLKNNGFYTFHKQYLLFKVDTTALKDTTKQNRKLAHCRIVVNRPAGEEKYHRQYKIDKVIFEIQPNTEVTNSAKPDYNEKVSSKGVIYKFAKRRIPYSSHILDYRVQVEPGAFYQYDQVLRTKSLLGALDMFKFVNTTFEIPKDSNDQKVGRLVARIKTSPVEKYQFTSEAGVTVGQGLPGPFVNLSLKNRNLFGGAEVFETNFQYTLDGQASFSDENQNYSSQELSLNTALNFPVILFPTRLRFLFNDYGPKTRINVGYNFVQRPEYNRTNLRSSMTYLWFSRYSSYNFTLSEISFVNVPRISSTFREQLLELERAGNPLIKSFERALVGSYYFTYTFNNTNIGELRNAHYIKLLAESGGTTFNLIDRQFLGGDTLIAGLKYFQFYRFNSSFHYYLPLNKKQKLAFRIHAGIARPYGVSETLPYEKFYFAGGSNSVRAWAPRRLGPGSHPPELREGTQEFDYSFEQPGEIIFEANMEYRFPIYGFFEGALFVDAGNVWMIEADNRPGSEFKFPSFFQEIAVGVGFGLRLNFSFLLIRLDAGVKAYDPARAAGSRYILGNFNLGNPGHNGQTLLNLGIGYPF